VRKAVGPLDECISGSVITRVRHQERDKEISYVTNYSIVLRVSCSSLFSPFFPILSSDSALCSDSLVLPRFLPALIRSLASC
jgi:hypothetical protein